MPKAMATGSPLPAVKEMGHTASTTTALVKVVLPKEIADWARAEPARAPRKTREYILMY